MSFGILVYAAAAAAAPMQDWRVVAPMEHEIYLADARTVRRRANKVTFQMQVLRVDPAAADYDFLSLDVSSRCNNLRTRTSRVIYRKNGQDVAAPSGRDTQSVGAWVANNLCQGVIGYRSFADPTEAIADYRRHRSHERLVASITPETTLTGTVVIGFESNAVYLCGSEDGCSATAPAEVCWLDGALMLPPFPPAPSEQRVDPMRRDAVAVSFRGRILRSPSGRGFGHVNAYGCQVEANGKAAAASIPLSRTAAPAYGANGRTPEAVAAHAALEAAVRSAGTIQATQDGHRWQIDEFDPRPEDWEAACGSDMEYQNRALEPYPSAIMWASINGIDVAGTAITIRTGRPSEETQFYLATPAAAARLSERLNEIRRATVLSTVQEGTQAVVVLNDGRTLVLDHPDTAEAVQTAGIVQRFRERRLVSTVLRGNQLSALLERRVTISFSDAGKAREVAALMSRLQQVCSASAVST